MSYLNQQRHWPARCCDEIQTDRQVLDRFPTPFSKLGDLSRGRAEFKRSPCRITHYRRAFRLKESRGIARRKAYSEGLYLGEVQGARRRCTSQKPLPRWRFEGKRCGYLKIDENRWARSVFPQDNVHRANIAYNLCHRRGRFRRRRFRARVIAGNRQLRTRQVLVHTGFRGLFVV